MKFKTITYTGNATDNTGITGIGFQPLAVIVKGDTAQHSVMRNSGMGTNMSMKLSDTGTNFTTGIKSLDADGFTLGTDASVNGSGITYYAFCIGDPLSDNDISSGTYAGNGVAGRNIVTTPGILPELLILVGDINTEFKVFADSQDTQPYEHRFPANADATTGIQLLNSNGFQVSAANEVNSGGANNYYYVTVKNVTTGNFRFKAGNYTGDGTASHAITGLGFKPSFVLVKIVTTSGVTADFTRGRTADIVGANCLNFAAASANSSNAIISIDNDGFTLGSDSSVNTSSQAYHYFVWGSPVTATGQFLSTHTKYW